MAFYKNPSAIRRSILAFVKHMLSKPLYRGFDFLLSPCCVPDILTATATCVGSTYTVVLTLANGFSFGSQGTATLLVTPASGNVEVGGAITYLDNTTVTFTTVSATAGAAELQLRLFLPTNSTRNAGVVAYSNLIDVTFSACP